MARSFLLFLLAGPLIGALPYSLLFLLLSASDPALAVLPLLFAYPFGMIPAALAGVVFLVITERLDVRSLLLSSRVSFAVGAFSGLIGCLSIVPLLAASAASLTSRDSITVFVVIAVPAIIAGGTCSVLAANEGSELHRLARLVKARWEIWSLAVVLSAAAAVLLRGFIAT